MIGRLAWDERRRLMSARQLGMFGPADILRSYDTYQFNDYTRYDAAQIDAAHKAEVHESQFPIDLENAYELGKRLVRNSLTHLA